MYFVCFKFNPVLPSLVCCFVQNGQVQLMGVQLIKCSVFSLKFRHLMQTVHTFIRWQNGRRCRPWSDSSWRSVSTGCPSVCIFWLHSSMVNPHCSHCRIITTILWDVQIFQILQYCYGEVVVLWNLNQSINNWAASWQNQQSECAPSEDSGQPGYLPSLIRVFSLGIRPVWSESSLCA